MYVVVESKSRAIVAVNPPLDSNGVPIVPERPGTEYLAVEIRDSEGAKLGGGSATYSLEPDNTIKVTPVAADPPPPVLGIAQSCVGVQIQNLTPLQQRSLLACLLYKAGGLDSTMTVQPLGEWVR